MLQAMNSSGFPSLSQFEAIGWLNRLLPAPDAEKVEELARWFCQSMRSAATAAAGDTPDERRQRVATVLQAVVQLINLFDPGIARDVQSHAVALADLDRGVVHPTLVPKPIDCRPPELTEVWQGRAYLALAVDAWCRLGVSPLDAARNVLSDSGLDVNPATLVDWRKKLGGHNAIKHQAVKAMFATERRKIANLDYSSLESCACIFKIEALRILNRH